MSQMLEKEEKERKRKNTNEFGGQTTVMVYDTLNKKWKEACRIVFGQEIGELKDYEEWLSEYKNGGFLAKSSFSGEGSFAYAK